MVQRNNLHNRRLSGILDANSASDSESSFSAEALCSPRLSKVDMDEEQVVTAAPRHVFTFDSEEVCQSKLESFRCSLSELPSQEAMNGVVHRLQSVMGDRERVLQLFVREKMASKA